jgi:hypothetical protein
MQYSKQEVRRLAVPKSWWWVGGLRVVVVIHSSNILPISPAGNVEIVALARPHVNTYFVNSYISIVERVNHTLLAETILTLSFPSGRPPFRFWFWKGWVFVFISSSVAFSKKGPWPLNVSSQKVAFRIIQLWPRPAVSSAPYTQDFRFEGVRHEKACEAAEKTALQGSFAATSGL